MNKNKNKYDIRPKTALLLAYLIEYRHKIISKKELFQAVWQTEHVQDHTLFQVISEIRKLSKSELIRTQPNIGYQWIIPTSQLKNNSNKIYLSLAASFMCIASSVLFFTYGNKVNIKTSNLPAISAYSKAVIALSNNDSIEAQKWLEFSLEENPESSEAQLLLAESLFLQNKFTLAESYAKTIFNDKTNSAYSYSMAADLLSRIYSEQGLVFDALEYAINGANILKASQAACSIAVTTERVESLLIAVDDSQHSQQQKDKIEEHYYKLKIKHNTNDRNQLKQNVLYSDMCEQIKKLPSTSKKIVCIPFKESEYLLSYQVYSQNTLKT